MDVRQKILLINETQNHSPELEIILQVAGYDIAAQSSMFAAMNLYSLLKTTQQPFDIVLVVIDQKSRPYLNFFKKDGLANLILFMSKRQGHNTPALEEDAMVVSDQESLLDTLHSFRKLAAFVRH